MVNHPPPFHNNRKGEARRKTRRKEKRKRQNKQMTQWCSGITCVLAGLRAHYPEHQHNKKRKTERKEDKQRYLPHTTANPNTTTQHNKTTHTTTTHTTVSHSTAATVQHPPTALLHPQQTQQHKTEEEQERYEGNGQCEGERTMRDTGSNSKTGNTAKKTGTTQHTLPPPFNGTTTHRRGTPHTRRVRPATRPPFTHHATHHHNGTPPSTMAPPSTTTRGGHSEDTPPHEQHRHTLTTRTTHSARNSARHDSSTRQHCTGTRRARAAPLHWAGQQ